MSLVDRGRWIPLLLGIALLLVISFGVYQQATAQQLAATVGTAFTYQGQLSTNGAPANGSFDFRFSLYEAVSGGTPLSGAPVVSKNALNVTNGQFTTQLDFGNVFNSSQLYLEISVRPVGASSYTTLTPRQPLTAVPFAVRSLVAANAEQAQTAQQAVNAQNATVAETAKNAVNATNAQNAVNATNAQNAVNATNAQNAVNATNATNAQNAVNAQTAQSVSWNNITDKPTGTLRQILIPGSGLGHAASPAVTQTTWGLQLDSTGLATMVLPRPVDWDQTKPFTVTLYFAAPSVAADATVNWRLLAGSSNLNLTAADANTGWDVLDINQSQDAGLLTIPASFRSNTIKSQSWVAQFSSLFNTWYMGSSVTTNNDFSNDPIWQFSFQRGIGVANGETLADPLVIVAAEVSYVAK